MASRCLLRLSQRVQSRPYYGFSPVEPQIQRWSHKLIANKYFTTIALPKTSDFIDDLIAAFVSSPDTYSRNEVLHRISRLSGDLKADFSIRLSTAEVSQDVKTNIELQLLLGGKATDSEVLLFIVENINCALNSELLEVFALRLVRAENLSAVVTYLHILSNKHPKFSLSNESWSLLTSKVCELGHYLGASLIFNEVIDSHMFYNTKEYSVLLRNSHIPFLVTPPSLEKLAMIFMHNGDSKAIEGLQDYFKRFYSYQGHSETYKTLGICFTEALSKSGSFAEAIDSFRVLAYKFKGHHNFKKDPTARTVANIRAADHFKSDRDNVKNNTSISPTFTIPEGYKTKLDRIQEQIDNSSSAVLFRPYGEQNVYSSPDKRYNAVIYGSLKVNDFVYFRKLITANIENMLNSESSQKIEQLIRAINSVHFMLHPFVISSLCELGHVKDAHSLLISLSKYYPTIFLTVLFKEDSFAYLLESIGKQLSECPISQLEELLQLSSKVFNYYCEVAGSNKRYDYSSRVFSCYITNLLSSTTLTLNLLRVAVDRFSQNANKPIVITLSKENTRRFKQLYSSKDKLMTSVIVCEV